MNSFASMDEVYVHLASKLENAPKCAPRGMEIKELIGESFELTDPRNRLIHIKERNSSLFFSIGEFLWYLRGSNELEIIKYYSKMYLKFSDDNATLHGAYGKRIFDSENAKTTQWGNIIELLKRDNSSRQAVISIFNLNDLNIKSKDIPCTCIFQYFVREEKLHCLAYMRSNDLYLGLPYDVFSFTMLQELLANELGVELGTYKHVVGSLHVYSQHYDVIGSHVSWEVTKDLPMKRMPNLDNYKKELLLSCEESLRLNNSVDEEVLSKLDPYWRQFIDVLKIKAEAHFTGNIKLTQHNSEYKLKLVN